MGISDACSSNRPGACFGSASLALSHVRPARTGRGLTDGQGCTREISKMSDMTSYLAWMGRWSPEKPGSPAKTQHPRIPLQLLTTWEKTATANQ